MKIATYFAFSKSGNYFLALNLVVLSILETVSKIFMLQYQSTLNIMLPGSFVSKLSFRVEKTIKMIYFVDPVSPKLHPTLSFS